MNNLLINLQLNKEGVLVPATPEDIAKLKAFQISLTKEMTVQGFFTIEKNKKDGNLGQLAKVHAMIRDLAESSGYTFQEMKEQVKKRAGLYEVTSESSSKMTLKSFGKASTQDLSKAIETCIEIGQLIGYPIH